MAEELEVVKGGVCWIELALNRGPRGLVVHVKTVPEIEEFMKALGDAKDAVEVYGRSWQPHAPTRDLEVYRQNNSLTGDQPLSYTISKPCEPLVDLKVERVNLSFLRFVGVGDPQGVCFVITEPFSEPYVTKLSRMLVLECKHFVQDFIVPVHINLRISSQSL